jgi:MFS transporter, ACS family, tartrate transporter
MRKLTADPARDMPVSADDATLERVTMARVTWRLMPILFVVYIFNFLDRTNVGLAALQMNRDLGLSSAAFGLGAGVFFIGYAFFEIPSNLALVRFGARRWIARIAISWGILAALLMLVRTPTQFYVLRFLLGVAEAGFFPAVLYYLTQWYPSSMRARANARFIIAIPLSGAIGGPLGAKLLGLDGLGGLHGWQWLFLLEGIPSVLLGVLVLRYLTERPEDADWLTVAQRGWLVEQMRRDRENAAAAHRLPPLRALANPLVWLAGLPLFFLNFSGYGYIFWGPTMIREGLDMSTTGTGWILAVIATTSAITLLIAGSYADRTRNRPLHAAFWAGVVALACLGAALIPNPVVRVACLAFIQIGGSAFLPSFVAIPTMLLAGPSVAIGVALVNSIGNLAGFGAPSLIGWLRQLENGTTLAFYALSGFAMMASVVLLIIHARVRARITVGAGIPVNARLPLP